MEDTADGDRGLPAASENRRSASSAPWPRRMAIKAWVKATGQDRNPLGSTNTGLLLAFWSALDGPTRTSMPSPFGLMSPSLIFTSSAARNMVLRPNETNAAFLAHKKGFRLGGRASHSLRDSTGKGSRSRGQFLSCAASRRAPSTALATRGESVGSGYPASTWRCRMTVMKVLRDETLEGVWCRSAIKERTVGVEAGSWDTDLDAQELEN